MSVASYEWTISMGLATVGLIMNEQSHKGSTNYKWTISMGSATMRLITNGQSAWVKSQLG